LETDEAALFGAVKAATADIAPASATVSPSDPKPSSAPASAPGFAPAADHPSAPVPAPESDAPKSSNAPEADAPDSEDDDSAPDTAAMTPPPLAARRGLDESLMAVLREEADRETAVRRAETPRAEPRGLESQTDLGLEDTSGAAGAAKAVRDRLARLRGPEPEPEKPAARRDLLPDIEEINSTLRASTENRGAAAGDDLSPAQNKPAADNGFRSGFSLMLLIAVVLVVIYVAAPRLAEQFPAAQGALAQYVAGVDSMRIWLDGTMKSAIAGLQGLTGS
jgi:hypothetical protein